MKNILNFKKHTLKNILNFRASDVNFNVHTGSSTSFVQLTIHQHWSQERVLSIKRPTKMKIDFDLIFKTIVESLKWIKTKCRSCYTVFFLKRQSHH